LRPSMISLFSSFSAIVGGKTGRITICKGEVESEITRG
jgi:hypothetical protein